MPLSFESCLLEDGPPPPISPVTRLFPYDFCWVWFDQMDFSLVQFVLCPPMLAALAAGQ